MSAAFPKSLTRVARSALSVLALIGLCTPQAHAVLNAPTISIPGQGTWETSLQGRDLDGNLANGYEAYYDTALNITWLADANYAQTSGFASDGTMDWSSAKTWAASLNMYGLTGWRLPTVVDKGPPGCTGGYSGTDCGYNVDSSSSEMAHMFYVTWGSKSWFDTSGNHPSDFWSRMNFGPFKNVSIDYYWSDVEDASNTSRAWSFVAGVGAQNTSDKSRLSSAWAVHPGDVGMASITPSVPEPESYALALVSMATLVGVTRRKQH